MARNAAILSGLWLRELMDLDELTPCCGLFVLSSRDLRVEESSAPCSTAPSMPAERYTYVNLEEGRHHKCVVRICC